MKELQGIEVRAGAKAHMTVPAPALAMQGVARQASDAHGKFIHGKNVRVHSLSTVQPILLAFMS